MRYFTGDYVAAIRFQMSRLDMHQKELACETSYSQSYLSSLLNRKQYSPDTERHIMETLQSFTPPVERPFPKPESTFYHLRLSSKSRTSPEAVDIDCYGDIICLVKFIMSAYGMSREDLAACMGCSHIRCRKFWSGGFLILRLNSKRKLRREYSDIFRNTALPVVLYADVHDIL